MKKLLGILVIGLLLNTSAFAAKKWGKGELKLSPKVVKAFIKYIKGQNKKSPLQFAVSEDGLEYEYYVCRIGLNKCHGADLVKILKQCEEKKEGIKCSLFANTRTIRWDNGISKNTKIERKWNDTEIIA